MQDLSTQVKSEWLSLKEAAELKGVTVSAISHALRLRVDLKARHFKKIGKNGYITKEGLFLLYTTKETPRRISGLVDESRFKDALVVKESIAQSVVDWTKDPLIMVRIQQLEQEKRLTVLEEKLGATNKLLEDATPVDITASQRQFLNERVRNLAIKSGLPFSHVWGLVHDHVGKRPLEAYEFSDYPKAMKLVKKIYDQYKLE